nr:MAG TPA: CCSMST1 family protein [Caudoviricetes sp.]
MSVAIDPEPLLIELLISFSLLLLLHYFNYLRIVRYAM